MDKQKELAKNTLIITIGKICTQFMSFFLMPLYTSVLSTSEYGIVDLLATYTALLAPIIFFQVDQAVFRFLIDIRDDKKRAQTLISTTGIFMLLQLIVSSALFFVIQLFINVDYKWYLLFSVFAAIISNMMLQITRGLGDNTSFAVGSFISAFLQIIFNIILLTVFKMGVGGMLIATIISQFLSAVYLFFRKKIYGYIGLGNVSKSCLKEVLSYSLPLVPNSLCWWALSASDRTIVMWFLGMSANGLLSVGHKFSSIYITLYNIFNLSWTESAALHMNDSDRDVFFSDVITNMFKLFMCAGIGLVAVMPFAFKLLINEQYGEAYGLIPVFVLASMFNVVVGLYSVIYVALKKTDEIAKTSLYAGIINIATHLILVKWIGLYAAPVSSVIAFASMSIYRYFDTRKYVKIDLKLETILIILILFTVGMGAYYSKNLIIQTVWLISISIISFVINKNMLMPMIRKVLSSRGK